MAPKKDAKPGVTTIERSSGVKVVLSFMVMVRRMLEYSIVLE